MTITQPSTVTFTPQAQELLIEVTVRCNRVDQYLKGELRQADDEDLSEEEPITFINALTKLLWMGGEISKESDTMLIANTRSGMTVGMHFDGKVWSLHS